jgi:hypothetical protein
MADTLRSLNVSAATDNPRRPNSDPASCHPAHRWCACGQSLCECKDCRVFYPCCCRLCWEAAAPRPPVTTVHNCTCAPAALRGKAS